MLGLLSNKSKSTNNSLINELINPISTNASLDKIYTNSNIDLNSLFINDEPILLVCCKKDLFNSILWLLENKINIELVNSLKETAIFYAIYSKDSKVIETLIDFGVNLNHLNYKNRTLLQESIHNASNKIIRFLLQKHISITNCDLDGNNLLFDAINNGNMNLIKKIISFNKIDINHKNKAGNSVFHLENSKKNLDLALYLLNNDADPTITNQQSLSYLFFIVTKGLKSIGFIRRAMELKFNLNIKNSDNKNILMCAVDTFLELRNRDLKDSQAELIKELVQLDLNVQAIDNENETIFFNITRSLDRDLIHYLLNNLEKLNLNKQNSNGVTVLMILILSGIQNSDLIKLYIEKGASLEHKNKNMVSVIELLIDTILHIENNLFLDDVFKEQLALDGQYKDILELLLKNYQVDLNVLNSKDEPLFFSSLLNFNFLLFKILRTKTLDINQKDIDENNILFRLLEQDYSEHMENRRVLLNTIKNLVNVGLDINSLNKEGLTALQFAILKDKEDIVKLLLELKADTTTLDDKGRNLIHMTIFKDRANYIKIINLYNPELMDMPDNFGAKAINYAAFMGKKHVVIELIGLDASINNTHKKSPKILEFLKKYHSNILSMSVGVDDIVNKSNLNRLAENMILEFDINISKN